MMWMYVAIYLVIGLVVAAVDAAQLRDAKSGIIAGVLWPMWVLAAIFTIIVTGRRR